MFSTFLILIVNTPFFSHTGPCFLRGAIETLANLSDGDARVALNGLEMAINCFPANCAEAAIDEKQIASVFQKNPLLYDRNGEEHYNIISAFHKSIRGSDDTATLYWLARMLEGGEDPLYIGRRMIRAASEDIGMYCKPGFLIPKRVLSGYLEKPRCCPRSLCENLPNLKAKIFLQHIAYSEL